MFETIHIVTLALILALAGMMVMWWSGRRHWRNMQLAMTEQKQQIDIMKNDVRALFAGAVGGDSRLYKLETRSRRIVERQEQMENNKQTERPYEQAIRMVHQGSKVEDIMAVCHLSKGEADLIIMMHSADKAESEPAEQFH